MKALIVVESWFGNTRAVADAIAEGLGTADVETEVVDVRTVRTHLGDDVDLLAVGGPTHAFGMTRPGTRADAVRQGGRGSAEAPGIREFLERLEAPRSLPVVTFDTRVTKVRRLPGSAARGAAKALRGRGFSEVDKPRSFYVDDVKGPLEDGELDRARAWGESLARTAALSDGPTPAP
jgi:hypothetical protein